MPTKSALWRVRISRCCIARVPQKLDAQLKRAAVVNNIGEESLEAIVPSSEGCSSHPKTDVPEVFEQTLSLR
jgi:hypothetical protein